MTKPIWAADGGDDAVVARIKALVARPGTKTIAVPGGTTPAPIFARLAEQNLDWPGMTLWPTDERIVASHNRASNIGRLMKAFGTTGARLQPLAVGQPVPRFDLVWLGMGEDGHVASLFPNTDPDPAAPAGVIRVVPDPLPADAPYERLTLTLAALAASDAMIIVVRGAPKRALLEAAVRGDNDLPVARLLRLATPTIYWSP